MHSKDDGVFCRRLTLSHVIYQGSSSSLHCEEVSVSVETSPTPPERPLATGGAGRSSAAQEEEEEEKEEEEEAPASGYPKTHHTTPVLQ